MHLCAMLFLFVGALNFNIMETKKTVTIKAPNFQIAEFEIKGIAPLVIHRFSRKTLQEMKQKMETGKAASSKRNREAKSTQEIYNESKYISKEGWEGFHAGAIRGAMISACRLVGFKMTLAKLSVFVIQDGWDALEPQVPLIRIYGESIKQEDMARVETGQPYVCVRAAYHNWYSKVVIRWDADQFTIDDVYNLLSRVGQQVGICEGRPDSKKSTGMGWGLFEVTQGKLIKS
jgi:ribosomal protein S17